LQFDLSLGPFGNEHELIHHVFSWVVTIITLMQLTLWPLLSIIQPLLSVIIRRSQKIVGKIVLGNIRHWPYELLDIAKNLGNIESCHI
jgi:hypothetical protein